jgi:hypothetical protein
MQTTHDGWPYWSVDLPGLSRLNAQQVLEMAERSGLSFGGTLVDPAQFLTLHLDRPTVEAVYVALSRGQECAQIAKHPDAVTVNGFTELLEEWLSLDPPADI